MSLMHAEPAADAAMHPDATELVELACGDLEEVAAVWMERHCLVCDGCARQLRALVGLRDLCGLTVPPAARNALGGLAVEVRQH